MNRRDTRPVSVGGVAIGGGAPIVVQSMTNTDTRDVAATLAQIARLARRRLRDRARRDSARATRSTAFAEIVAGSPIPVVADVHFDHTIAIEAARAGAAKLRINPGNIGDMARVDAVIEAAGEAGIPIRIGVNAGCLAEEYHDLDWPLERKLAASAVAFCRTSSPAASNDIVVSAKASSVNACIEAYRLLADEIAYPLHIGVTEAGHRVLRHRQVERGSGRAARRGHRRHAARLAHRRPGRGGPRGLGDPRRARHPPPRTGDDQLPHVRPVRGRPHPHRRGGRAPPARSARPR